MKFNHLFYDSNVNFKSISKKRIVLSILLGLASAILIYSFFSVLRETDRMLFLDFEERPIVVPETDRQLFNLFFAAISLILGNSITICFLFSRPQKVFSKRNNKRSRIINDQVFLGFNFIHWFAKVWFLFAVFSSQFMGSKFIINFLLPSTLLILVLYLDAWKTLSFVIKKNRWKIKMVHFISFLILTFLLSNLDVVDYRSIDEFAHSAHPTIEVPKSLYENDTHQKRSYDDLVFKIYFNSKNEPHLFNAQNEQIELNDIYKILNDNELRLSEELVSRRSVRLRIDKEIPIKFIKRVELELLYYNQQKIIYETSNDDDLTLRFYNNQLRHRISPSLQHEFPVLEGMPPRIPIWDFYKDISFVDTLRINVSNKILLNETSVSIDNLSTVFKNHINSTTIFEYKYDSSTTYQDFIYVLSAHKKAVWELTSTDLDKRYSESDLLYNKYQFIKNDSLIKEKLRLKQKFPMYISERYE